MSEAPAQGTPPHGSDATGDAASEAAAVVTAFEEAMAAGNGSLAASLAEQHPDKAKAMIRAWNMLAYGEDSPEPFSLETMKAKQLAAAERGVAWIIEHHGGRMDCDEPYIALREHGGGIHDRDAPWIAYQLIFNQCLTPEAVRYIATWAWRTSEFPEANLDVYAWLVVLHLVEEATGARLHDADDLEEDDDDDSADEAGVEEEAAEPPATWEEPDGLFPAEPVTLYRGAVEDRALGMAWTSDQATAEWFARRFSDSLDGRQAKVWQVTVAPERVRARFDGRREHEYVIDPLGLVIGEGPDDVRPVTGAVQ